MNKVKVGQVLKHINETWEATVLEINVDENTAKMYLQSERGWHWDEEWNLAHTNTGLFNGEYVDITPQD